MASRSVPGSIDEYIATCSPDVRSILEKIRLTIREAAPRAEEKISYGMPAFAMDGDLIYFAAFKKHIGVIRFRVKEHLKKARPTRKKK